MPQDEPAAAAASWRNSFSRWFRRYGSPTIAFLSMIVAAVALWVAGETLTTANESQRLEREYKELSIRPFLHFRITPNFGLILRNDGLGPAVIDKVAFLFNDKCYRFEPPATDWWEISGLLSQWLYRDTLMKQVDAKKVIPTMEDLPVFLRVGETFDVVKFSPEIWKTLEDDLNKVSSSEYNKMRHDFLERGANIPLAIAYCSASRKYCSGIMVPSAVSEQMAKCFAE